MRSRREIFKNRETLQLKPQKKQTINLKYSELSKLNILRLYL